MYDQKTICVVIPCFKVKNHIQEVISNIPSFVDAIIAVDDCCPEKSGEFIQKNIQDPRLSVLFHKQNLGVGGAVSSGYQEALRKKMDIIVKIDGDNQMDISLLPEFIAPLVSGKADYAKGNRFYWFDGLQDMPTLRLFGNSGLSFVNKLSSGYWEIMDPLMATPQLMLRPCFIFL
jgi:dolichol-phosphate mannosyltransferase